MTITHYSEFSGLGGTDHGAHFVGTGWGNTFTQWVESVVAANHDKDAVAEYQRNNPNTDVRQADVTKLDMETMPRVDLFTASPACPAWTTANGVKRDFDQANAEGQALFEMPGATMDDPKLRKRVEQYKRTRLLMWEVIRYLRACHDRDPNNPVLIGLVENVVQCRLWAHWDEWIGEFRKLGYEIKVIAFNSMHAQPVRAPYIPQSRNRLYVAYWHRSIGREPDWDKWLRPRAFCENCAELVDALQVFKKPKNDMGTYGKNGQYIYRCPNLRCGREVFPEAVPALAAIDLTRPAAKIGERESLGMKPLEDSTLGRIGYGMKRHWEPLLVPVGGTWRTDGVKGAQPLARPAPTTTTRETDGVALPPLMIPVEGRAEATRVTPATDPVRTMTCRAETAVALPFIASLRGGGCKDSAAAARSVSEPAATVSAQGNHHGLVLPPAMLMRNVNSRGDKGAMCTPLDQPARTVVASNVQSVLTLDALLVPYYGSAKGAQRATDPIGTLTTRDRYGLATADGALLRTLPSITDVRFRMLDPDEVGLLMGFDPSYRNEARARRTRIRLYGNAVTPAVAELIVSALVECLSGETLERDRMALAA